MKGLWHLPTQTIDVGGTGVVAFDALGAGLVTIMTCFTIALRPKEWPQAKMIYTGMIFLCIFFILNWIDIMIRHYRTPVTYDYLLFACVNHIFRVFSDIFVLWGACRLMRRYHTLRREPYGISAVFAVLIFIGAYQICLLFSLAFTWLGFADLHAINDIAKARSAFEVTFSTFMFIGTLSILGIWAGFYQWTAITPFDYEVNSHFLHPLTSEPPTNLPQQWRKAALTCTLIFLALRSFTDLITIGQQNRSPAHLPTILRARDVTYGLFSLPMTICIPVAIPANKSADPLVARKDEVMSDLTTRIIRRLRVITQNCTKTAPDIDEFLEGFEDGKAARNSTFAASLAWERAYMVNDEVGRLRSVYRGWTPIQKWRGAAVDTGPVEPQWSSESVRRGG
ncbi:uncharacterized protein BDZ99DRAFT_517848 [Mytilinidion resinicola]|uniref:Integral membrane protein n=1 Tax=Mytilinidion resinicola TaxID=574789 RepID=A0A6A6YYM5_9PEZI|nr:uncharacterized protein BDZ99DRAFT_517848 [Mytilinidion resinicola]KAF2813599.1 hypothetical protein BDZ99DRAFT_517848 [Mytilinidion resinicola]